MPKHLFKWYLTEEKNASVEDNQGYLLPTQRTQWRCVGQRQVMLGVGDTVLSLRGTHGKISSDIEVSEPESGTLGPKHLSNSIVQTIVTFWAELSSQTRLEKWAEGFCEHAIGCPELVFLQTFLVLTQLNEELSEGQEQSILTQTLTNKKMFNCEVKNLTCTPHRSVLFTCFGHWVGTDCRTMCERLHSQKMPDTLMTRSAELSTYVLLGFLCLIHITVFQELIPRWCIMNLKKTSGSTKTLQDIRWFSWPCVRAPILHTFL